MSNTRLGLIRCEHCGRQFNPHSGARHIPWCEKQQNENRKRRLSVEKRQALERYKWRISYRPTNIISTNNNANQQQESRRFNVGTNKFKKSSTNSSATLSSPSASSSNSVTSSANNDTQISRLNRQRSQLDQHSTNFRRQQQQQLHHPSGTAKRSYQSSARQTPVAQLKRSISSLTLTKQQGVCSSTTIKTNPAIAAAASATTTSSFAPLSWQKTALIREGSSLSGKSDATFAKTSDLPDRQHRTKSVNDLSNMSEIVETLAKRMDAIYAQNQALLASLSRGNLNKQRKQLAHNRANLLNSDEDDDNDDHHNNLSDGPQQDDDDDNDELNEMSAGQVNCHHCKASCMKRANYCHKCGCKVYITTANSTATMSSESPG